MNTAEKTIVIMRILGTWIALIINLKRFIGWTFLTLFGFCIINQSTITRVTDFGGFVPEVRKITRETLNSI